MSINFACTPGDEDYNARGTERADTESGEFDELGRRSFKVAEGSNYAADADSATTVTGILLNLSTKIIITGSEADKCGRTAVDEDGKILRVGAPVGGDIAIGVVIATKVTGVGKKLVVVTDKHSLGVDKVERPLKLSSNAKCARLPERICPPTQPNLAVESGSTWPNSKKLTSAPPSDPTK